MMIGDCSSWSPELSETEAKRVAVVGVDARVCRRVTRMLFHAPAGEQSQEQDLAEWINLPAWRIQHGQAPVPG